MKKSTGMPLRMPKENSPDHSEKILEKLKNELAASRKELEAINEKLVYINEELDHSPAHSTGVSNYLSALARMVTDPVVLLDGSLCPVFANDVFYNTFQLATQTNIQDRPIYETVGSPTDLNNWEKLIKVSGTREGATYEFTIAHRYANQEEKLFKLRTQSLFFPKGVVNYILVTAERIIGLDYPLGYDEKDADAFKLMAENAPVMIWVSDTEQKRNYFNKAWLRFTGRTLKEESGHGWESGIHPEDLERSVKIFQNAFKKREAYKKEYRLKRKDGEYRWILSQGVPFFKNEKFAGYIGSCVDINYRVEQELQKDEFLAVVSHELKTPLTTIEVYTDLLHQLLMKDDNQELAEFTGKINIQINNLIFLINEMLDISRITGKTLFLNKELLNINTLMEGVIREKQPILKSHQLLTELGPVKEILGDKVRLVQVLDNIISNAVKYSPDARQVYIRTEQEDDWVTIVIRDEGVGIPPGDQKKIFKRFFRSAETAKTFPGIGLGLYISHEIIRRHNGLIEVESQQGEGTVFRIKLPAAIYEPGSNAG